MSKIPKEHEYDTAGQCIHCTYKDPTQASLSPAPGSADDCCPDWTPQMKLIDSYIVLQAVRSGQHDQFTSRGGKQFKFCPWCGKAKPQNAKLTDPAHHD